MKSILTKILFVSASLGIGSQAFAQPVNHVEQRRLQHLKFVMDQLQGDVVCENESMQVVLPKNLKRVEIRTARATMTLPTKHLRAVPSWFGSSVVSFAIEGFDSKRTDGAVALHELNVSNLNGTERTDIPTKFKSIPGQSLQRLFVEKDGRITEEGSILTAEIQTPIVYSFYTCRYL